jgi:hypothetical protein
MNQHIRAILGSALLLSMSAALAACAASPAGSPGDESMPVEAEALPATAAVPELAADDLSSAPSAAPPPLSRCMAGGGICGWTAATCQQNGGQSVSNACGSPGVLCCFLDF